MANRMPSLLALLGLAAFAGYQNRDKIGGAIKDAQARRNTPAPRRAASTASSQASAICSPMAEAATF